MNVSWFSKLWSPSIPPRRSILAVIVLSNKIATYDNIRKCGLVVTSFCCMCFRSEENVQHLFFECPYAVRVWSWLLQAFRIPYVYRGDYSSFFKSLLDVHLSAQLKDMWRAGLVAVLWGIWTQRNKFKFEDVRPCFSRLNHGLLCWIKEAGIMSNGSMYNSVNDLLVLKFFGAPCHPRKAPKIVEVHWFPPLPGWYKCNTYGLSKPNGQAACGGVFRNCRGFVCGVFAQSLGVETAFFAEFYAVMLAVEEAYKRGWKKLWLEMDYVVTLQTFFNKEFVAPWKIRQRWMACHIMMADMQIRCSHIFREGNVPADIVSNVALLFPNFTWWCGIVPEIKGAVVADRLNRPKFRFC